MQGQCVIALYPSRSDAEQACRALLDAGIPDDHIRMSKGDGYVSGTTSVAPEQTSGGFWDWLFGGRVPEEDQRMYDARLASGQTAVSVLVDGAPSIANTASVEDILESCGPLDLHTEDEEFAGTASTSAAGSSSAAHAKERIIPLPEEELKVGKRASERVRRVRTYVVEEPVEQDVTLRDERVIVERRPATTASAEQPVQRDYEIREHHEEPVVEKRTRAGEELVVRKEGSERTEHVRDTVRKTKADIKDEGR